MVQSICRRGEFRFTSKVYSNLEDLRLASKVYSNVEDLRLASKVYVDMEGFALLPKYALSFELYNAYVDDSRLISGSNSNFEKIPPKNVVPLVGTP